MHAIKKTFAKGKIIYEQDNINKDCFIVTHGWAYRYTDLYDGSRQVISYYLPGDIINPFASAIPKSNYSVAAITNLRVSICKAEYLMELFATQPKLGLLYTALLSCGDASMAEQIVRIVPPSAYQHVTHLLLELYYRLRLVGHAENYTFYLPVTQSLLADTLGLSVFLPVEVYWYEKKEVPLGVRFALIRIRALALLVLYLITAGPALLETYGPEREYAADENLRNSTRATDFITPKSEASRLFRDAVLHLARDHAFARRIVQAEAACMRMPDVSLVQAAACYS